MTTYRQFKPGDIVALLRDIRPIIKKDEIFKVVGNVENLIHVIKVTRLGNPKSDILGRNIYIPSNYLKLVTIPPEEVRNIKSKLENINRKFNYGEGR